MLMSWTGGSSVGAGVLLTSALPGRLCVAVAPLLTRPPAAPGGRVLVQDEPGAVPLVVGESPGTSPGGGGPRPIQTGEGTGPGSPPPPGPPFSGGDRGQNKQGKGTGPAAPPPPEPALCAGDRAGH